jgi:hypothetical protein
MFDILLTEAKQIGKDSFELCSKTGDIKISNFSLNDSAFASKFPPGDYKMEFKFFDDIDENIYNSTLFVKIFQ